jgi:beta-glucosidase-like glycosyl hydrolase
VTGSVARLVFPALRWRPSAGGFAHERGKIDVALAAGVGGFIVFGGTREAVGTLTRELRAQAGRPLLIGADLERGPAQQVQGLTELPPPAALGWLDDLEATSACGMITAAEARSVGINWAFGPVCDLDLEPRNPIVQTRAFGVDPVRVGEQAAVWIRALQEHGVQGCAKHYPGHGRTTQDSHATLPRVHAAGGAGELQQVDGAPFEYAIRAGVGSVMSAFVAYPQWDSSGRAASFSSEILGYLRTTLNFAGLVVTDALIMAGATAAQPGPAATVRAVAAGCDALLYPQNFTSVVAALDRAVGTEIPVARADQALAHYDDALAAWGELPDQGEPDIASHAGVADGLADRAAHLVRGDPPTIRAPLAVSIVDDDVGGPYTVGPRDVFHATLRDAGVSIVQRATGNVQRIVLVYAEPRSWKGRANLGAPSRAALRRLVPGAQLVVLFGHPRLTSQIPGTAPILMCWHGQALMQRAAARRVITWLE